MMHSDGLHPLRQSPHRDPDLRDRIVVITGGGRGIGAALARRFSSAGASLVITGRDEGPLREVCSAIYSHGGQAKYVRSDVSDPADVARIFDVAIKAFGGVHVLINNAGIVGPVAELVDVSLDEWNEVLAVNLTGVFLCCKSAIPIMRRMGGGRIVTIGSATGKRPLPMRTPYAASKLALVGLIRTLAHEVGRYGITVNVISPYFVEGTRLERVVELMARSRGVSKEVIRREQLALSALGRAVREEDVANVALFLCSPAADSITGQDLNVSAGAVMY